MRRIVVFLAGLAICAALVPELTWAQKVAWQRTFGGLGWEAALSVQQTSDGGYILAGETKSYGAGGYDVWLIKTDPEGRKLWDRTFGGPDDDMARSVQQTSDGGYILAGWTKSYGAGDYDMWLIRTDSEGRNLWDHTFGESNFEWAFSVQQTSDGGYIVAGETDSYGAGEWDVWLIKTDPEGLKLWDRTFGGADRDMAWSMQQTSDGGYIVAGETYSYGVGGADVWLIKTDSEGLKLWDRTFGGAGWDGAYSVQQASDGGYILAGPTWSYGVGEGDLWLIKADSEGQKLWDHTFGGADYDDPRSVQQTSNGGYILAGCTKSYGSGGGDVWLVKIVEGEPVSVPISVLQDTAPQSFALFQNSPNPFNPLTTIAYDLPEASHVTLTFYTITGQKVAVLVHAHQQAGRHRILFDGSGYGTGVYLYRLEAGEFVETRRLVLLK